MNIDVRTATATVITPAATAAGRQGRSSWRGPARCRSSPGPTGSPSARRPARRFAGRAAATTTSPPTTTATARASSAEATKSRVVMIGPPACAPASSNPAFGPTICRYRLCDRRFFGWARIVAQVDGDEAEPELTDPSLVVPPEAVRERGEEREGIIAAEVGRMAADPDQPEVDRRSPEGRLFRLRGWLALVPLGDLLRGPGVEAHLVTDIDTERPAAASPSTISSWAAGSTARPRTIRATSKSVPHRPSSDAVRLRNWPLSGNSARPESSDAPRTPGMARICSVCSSVSDGSVTITSRRRDSLMKRSAAVRVRSAPSSSPVARPPAAPASRPMTRIGPTRLRRRDLTTRSSPPPSTHSAGAPGSTGEGGALTADRVPAPLGRPGRTRGERRPGRPARPGGPTWWPAPGRAPAAARTGRRCR